ncbi:PIH1 domain-containing protein [Meloidogyne graminicola]|uniref:PIH1 domain-containing protein n=1 Tax=Meloidogyne graminicola TaxID=189291 RepID=A0A8S9ZVU0_9BILA|nr:PIH1 domain-containing protein [Meloidogyne graminicola]
MLNKDKVKIVDRKEEVDGETWTIHPTPGICIKFKEAKYPSTSIEKPQSDKFFINLAHCIELPFPPKELWKDEELIAKMMETDKNSFKIPLSVGELEKVEDNKGIISSKVDVIVNSEFFDKCIDRSEFFRQITLAAICEKIKENYSIHLDLSKQIILKNKKYIGELNIRQIRKRPLNSVLDNNKILIREEEENINLMDIDDIEETKPLKPRNFKVQILNGEIMEIKIKVKDKDGELVKKRERLTLKMNDDRVVVLLDSSSTVADFFLPFRIIIDESTNCEFDSNSSTIFIKCKVDFE